MKTLGEMAEWHEQGQWFSAGLTVHFGGPERRGDGRWSMSVEDFLAKGQA